MSSIASGLIFRSSFHHDGCMKYNLSFRPRETNSHPLSWTTFKLIYAGVLPFFLLLIGLTKLSQKYNDKMTLASMKGSGLMSLRSHHTYSQLSANEYNIFLLPLTSRLSIARNNGSGITVCYTTVQIRDSADLWATSAAKLASPTDFSVVVYQLTLVVSTPARSFVHFRITQSWRCVSGLEILFL